MGLAIESGQSALYKGEVLWLVGRFPKVESKWLARESSCGSTTAPHDLEV